MILFTHRNFNDLKFHTMNIHRAGKQQKAYWRSENRLEACLEKEKVPYLQIQSALRGNAHGWIAGVAYAKRNMKRKAK